MKVQAKGKNLRNFAGSSWRCPEELAIIKRKKIGGGMAIHSISGTTGGLVELPQGPNIAARLFGKSVISACDEQEEYLYER